LILIKTKILVDKVCEDEDDLDVFNMTGQENNEEMDENS
jgi:hypothetical protein